MTKVTLLLELPMLLYIKWPEIVPNKLTASMKEDLLALLFGFKAPFTLEVEMEELT